MGADLFSFDIYNYLIVVDYFTGFWEVDRLQPDTLSCTVINKLRPLFARHGIPYVVVTDNGPHFASQEFAEFSEQWGFQHMTSSPNYRQSNGKAESAVKAAKLILKKCRHSGDDAWLAVLEHRNTPTQGLNSSLAQRLFERYTRTVLPVAPSTPKPQPTDPSFAARLKSRQEQQAATYNRHATPLRPLVIGESMWVRLGQQWHPARVVAWEDSTKL